MKQYQMLIGGNWVNSASGATREIRDPANGELIAIVPEGSREDARAAIDAARNAFDSGPFRRMTALERAKLLFKLAELINKEAGTLARLEVENSGKPLTEATYDMAD